MNTSKLSKESIGRGEQRNSDVSARRHNGLPLTIGIIRSMRTADEDTMSSVQDRLDRATMVELYREKIERLGGNEGIDFCESIGIRLPSLFEDN